jgi:hypothetical protein
MKFFRLVPFLSLTLVALVGCGANFTDGTPCSPNGFINQTALTDAQLLSLWKGAQTQIATQPIPLDPVTDPRDITYDPPDPKAMSMEPQCQVKVVAAAPAPNVPNGYACSQSPTGYCGGMTEGGSGGPWTLKIVSTRLNNPGTTGWEMQNVILYKLGVKFNGR